MDGMSGSGMGSGMEGSGSGKVALAMATWTACLAPAWAPGWRGQDLVKWLWPWQHGRHVWLRHGLRDGGVRIWYGWIWLRYGWWLRNGWLRIWWLRNGWLWIRWRMVRVRVWWRLDELRCWRMLPHQEDLGKQRLGKGWHLRPGP